MIIYNQSSIQERTRLYVATLQNGTVILKLDILKTHLKCNIIQACIV